MYKKNYSIIVLNLIRSLVDKNFLFKMFNRIFYIFLAISSWTLIQGTQARPNSARLEKTDLDPRPSCTQVMISATIYLNWTNKLGHF